MLKDFRTHLVLILAVAFAGPVLGQADPTLHEIYQAAETGHLDQAQRMVYQVLRDHPQSAKAHYVAAELYARERNLPAARQELSRAQSLEPGLPFARPDSVQRLQRELGAADARGSLGAYSGGSEVRSAFQWRWALVLVAAIALLWALFRRRTAAAAFQQYPGGAMTPAGAPGYGPVPGPGYGPGYGTPGMGSSIAGGLASGLAVGAGVVAGEELAHHFLDGDRRESGLVPPVEPDRYAQNDDLGGSDFGVSDPGSWDDGSVGGDISGGGDGGDWT